MSDTYKVCINYISGKTDILDMTWGQWNELNCFWFGLDGPKEYERILHAHGDILVNYKHIEKIEIILEQDKT